MLPSFVVLFFCLVYFLCALSFYGCVMLNGCLVFFFNECGRCLFSLCCVVVFCVCSRAAFVSFFVVACVCLACV